MIQHTEYEKFSVKKVFCANVEIKNKISIIATINFPDFLYQPSCNDHHLISCSGNKYGGKRYNLKT